MLITSNLVSASERWACCLRYPRLVACFMRVAFLVKHEIIEMNFSNFEFEFFEKKLLREWNFQKTLTFLSGKFFTLKIMVTKRLQFKLQTFSTFEIIFYIPRMYYLSLLSTSYFTGFPWCLQTLNTKWMPILGIK